MVGGVLAEEGFREGLKAIGMRNGLDPYNFFKTAEHIIYETGFGECSGKRQALKAAISNSGRRYLRGEK